MCHSLKKCKQRFKITFLRVQKQHRLNLNPSHLTALITSAVNRCGSQNQRQKYLEWRRLSKTQHSEWYVHTLNIVNKDSKGVKTGAGSLA